MPQPGFFDLDERYAKLNERDPLVKLNPIIDWEAFREPLSVLRNQPRKKTPRPAGPRRIRKPTPRQARGPLWLQESHCHR